MNTQSKFPWLRIILWAVLIHVILISISIFEVFLYSLLNPGLDNSLYEEHAKFSAPYVSIIFGLFIFILVLRHLGKKRIQQRFKIALVLPIIYTIKDFAIVHMSGVNWDEHLIIFLISFLVKMAGAFIGAFTLNKSSHAN